MLLSLAKTQPMYVRDKRSTTYTFIRRHYCQFPDLLYINVFQSDISDMTFRWNVSNTIMSQYFTEWESGYPKNR